MDNELLFNSLRARCAAEAAKAVTRWYEHHLYDAGEGATLEGYVKRMVLEVPDPSSKAPKSKQPQVNVAEFVKTLEGM